MTLTGGLTAALCFGYLTHLLRLSPIVGYLLAGIFVGPYTPGYIADQHLAEQLAEIGIILLMFGVGLHFQFSDLLKVRRVAIPGAIGQSIVATLLGVLVSRAFGWSLESGLIYGLAIAVASTVVLTRVLVDNQDLHTAIGHVSVGWLVIEDLFTVLVLVMLPVLFGGAATPEAIALAVGVALLKVVALVFLTFWLGSRAIPWLFMRMAETHSRELFTLTVLVLVLGIAVGSTLIFDVSMALGAFLAGMVIGRSEFSLRAASEALPMRDAFSVLFFVSVGMLLDPRIFIDEPALVAATLGIVIFGKAITAIAIVLLRGYPVKVALSVGVALAQIGEFSFILAVVGQQLGILTSLATNVLIATAIVSITLNPILYRLIDPLDSWISKSPRLSRWFTKKLRKQFSSMEMEALEGIEDPSLHHAIVIGYGPVGQTVTRLLVENGIVCTIVELNVETTRSLLAQGVRAIYGDASHRNVLEEAGISRAGSLILSASSLPAREEIIRTARELNPSIRIMARTMYIRELSALREEGLRSVFSGEAEVALALTEEILVNLGASPEQIERERKRVRRELLQPATAP